MKYCQSCKIYVENKCTANYKNPTTCLDKAINQANSKGEWPCSFAPHRAQFIDKYRPGQKVRVVKEGN